MADVQHLTDAMLAAAGDVFGRLVDLPVSASASTRNDRPGSITIVPETLVSWVKIPSLGIGVVVRFAEAPMVDVVRNMLGSGDAPDVGTVHRSIVWETACQVASSMADALASQAGSDSAGVTADLCTDATDLPAPPFASFDGTVRMGEIALAVSIDFDGIALAKLAAEQSAPARRASPAARPVAFAPMTPTPMRATPGGGNLDLVHDVPLQISAVLGRTALTLRDVVTLQSGSVFELDKQSSDPIDLYVNNILIARGEVVVVDDKFAVKISELNPSAG